MYSQDGPFFQVQVDWIKAIQYSQNYVPWLYFWSFITFLGFGFLYVAFILIWMVWMDFGGGILMFYVLMEAVFFNNMLKSFVKGTRPNWIDPDVITLECQATYGFPSGHVQILCAVMLYGGLYMCFGYRGQKWHSWPMWKRWVFFGLYLSQTAIFITMQAYSRLIVGVHFFSDLIIGILLGVLGFLFHVFLLYPLVIKPCAKYNMQTKSSGFWTSIVVAHVIMLVDLAMGVVSFVIPETMYPVPLATWEAVFQTSCPTQTIQGSNIILENLFKLVGAKHGLLISLFIHMRYLPFITFPGTVLDKMSRIVWGAIFVLPAGCLGGLYYVAWTLNVYDTGSWSVYAVSIALDIILVPLIVIYGLVLVPYLIHRANKRLMPMSFISWRNAFGLKLSRDDLRKGVGDEYLRMLTEQKVHFKNDFDFMILSTTMPDKAYDAIKDQDENVDEEKRDGYAFDASLNSFHDQGQEVSLVTESQQRDRIRSHLMFDNSASRIRVELSDIQFDQRDVLDYDSGNGY